MKLNRTPDLNDESERIKRTLGIVKKVCLLLGYKQKINKFLRVSKNENGVKIWNYFEAVHSEMCKGDTCMRGYIIEFFGGKRIIISIDGELQMPGYQHISINSIMSSIPKIGPLLLKLKDIESSYRRSEGIKDTTADIVHRSLIFNSDK